MSTHRQQIAPRLWLLLLSLTLMPTMLLANNPPIPHPACFDGFYQADTRAPYSINLTRCSRTNARLPSFDIEGMIHYERPRGPAGELRGMLGYERLTGPGNQVLYRLHDNQGGSGSDVSLILGYEVESSGDRLLLDSHALQTGSGCQLGPAWASASSDNLSIGLNLSPASLLTVLNSPEGELPNWRNLPSDRLPRCDHCCVGVAEYHLETAPHGWQLKHLQIDDPALLLETHIDAALLDILMALGSSNEQGLQLTGSNLSSLRAQLPEHLVLAHSPIHESALLQALGFIRWPRYNPTLTTLRHQRNVQAARLWLNPDATLPAPDTPLSRDELQALRTVLQHLDNPRLHPVDESDMDSSFANFIADLKKVVTDTDGEALVRMSAPDIMLGFGGSGGHADLRMLLEHPDSAADLWWSLQHAVAPGAVLESPEAFCLPYPSCLPGSIFGRFDPQITLFVTQPQAPLRAEPSDSGAIIRVLDHEVLIIDPQRSELEDAYLPVMLRDGTQGFIARTHAHWMIDYRLSVVRGPQGWRIQSLVGGD
ncbi:MAG: hypothetical protein CVV07_11850 [Gammaproteobacteria bacterium HGW-Gammaproteobacteria-11]|nr:MAG: hypothetical protein CVV07_11850 [Gammaproteobacteria bacterium HGW-Gammaproteobacteria-11]